MRLSVWGLNVLNRLPNEWKAIIQNEVVASLENNLSDYRTKILANFDSGLNPRGQAWAALSRRTLERKITGTILNETGVLRSSFIFEVKRTGDYSATMITDNTAESAPYHEYGTKKMPQRQILDTSEADIQNIINSIANRVKRQLEANKIT
jgi:phage gpG-like protein